MISVVFPTYNEEENVKELHKKINETMVGFGESYEIIAVDDGSIDKTVDVLKTLTPLKIVLLSRNMGQTSALDAGIKTAQGDVVVTLDADMQNNPADIPLLISKLREGYDVASGWRKKRNDPLHRKILSRVANWLTAKVSGLYLHDNACALKAYRKKVLEGVNLFGEMHVFLPVYLYSRGAKIIEVEVSHNERYRGESKHNFLKAVKNISDLLTIKFITSTVRPLILFSVLGLASWFLGFVSGTTAIVFKIIGYAKFGQTPLPLLTALLLIVGLIFFTLGLLAELLIRIYYESKNSMPYIIREIIDNK